MAPPGRRARPRRRASLHFAGWHARPRGAPPARPRRQRRAADQPASSTCCAVFVQHPGRVLSRDFLLEHTRGREAGPFDRTDRRAGRPPAQEARGRHRASADHQVGARRRLHPRLAVPPVDLPRLRPRPPHAATARRRTVFRSLFAAYPDGVLLVDSQGASCWPTRPRRRARLPRSTSSRVCTSMRWCPTRARRATPPTATRYAQTPRSRADGHRRSSWWPGAPTAAR